MPISLPTQLPWHHWILHYFLYILDPQDYMTDAICFPQTRMFLSCIFTLTNCYLCFNSQIKRSSLIPQTFSESRFLDSSNWVSLVAQRLKRLPGMRETRVRSLGWEDPLEKEMATHSSALAWRIPWREEPGRACRQDWPQRVRHNWAASLSLSNVNCSNFFIPKGLC